MRTFVRVVAAVLVGVTVLAVAPAPTSAQVPEPQRPMIFVHGFLGSGQQFETQALRFASNGYPAERIQMFEHDSLAYPGSQAEVFNRLDQMIAEALVTSGSAQVNLLAHSQGTGVVQSYLNSSPARAAAVARYVNIEGGAGGSVPESVETLALWGEGNADREVPGAANVHFPDQGHAQVVSSAESFVEMYRFLTGSDPQFPHIVREPADAITVSGRVILFPENAGAAGATLEIWEVDPATGRRLDPEPVVTRPLDSTGDFGPFDADGDTFYEFAIVLEGMTHHVYVQRFVRSSPWVRILTSQPGGLADTFWETSGANTNLVVFRNTEWWGDQGAASDSLSIDGTEVMTPALSPRARRIIGMFVHDEGLDGESDLENPAPPSGLPFLTGVDLHLPASTPPDDTIAVVTVPRRGDGPESVCVPNWASSTERVSIQLSNYHHLLQPDGSPAEGHAAPVCTAPVPDTPPPPPPGTDPPPPGTDPPPPGPATPGAAPPAVPVAAVPTFTG
jgi:hypothetical protein